MPPLTDRATLARSLGLLAFDPSPETPGRRWRATDRGVRLTVGMVPGTSAAGPPRRARSIPDRVDFPESPARAAWATPGTAKRLLRKFGYAGTDPYAVHAQRAVIVENEAVEPQRVAGSRRGGGEHHGVG